MDPSRDMTPLATGPAAQQAADWFITLRERPDDELLRRSFERWLSQSPDHARAYETALRAWTVSGETQSPTLRAELRRIGKRRVVARWLGVSVIAASIALFVAFPTMRVAVLADHRTGTAELREIVLEDGTKVTLNAGSAISVRYSDNAREIDLLEGDAFLEVVSDPTRPFVLTSDNVRAVVLGTAFDVRSGSGGVSVGVKHGRVRIESSGEPGAMRAELVAGELAQVRQGVLRKRSVDAGLIGGWIGGRLAVENTRLDEVAETLDRYFGGRIVIASATLRARRVTGNFELHDPESALRAATAPFAGVVRQVSPYLLVISDF